MKVIAILVAASVVDESAARNFDVSSDNIEAGIASGLKELFKDPMKELKKAGGALEQWVGEQAEQNAKICKAICPEGAVQMDGLFWKTEMLDQENKDYCINSLMDVTLVATKPIKSVTVCGAWGINVFLLKGTTDTVTLNRVAGANVAGVVKNIKLDNVAGVTGLASLCESATTTNTTGDALTPNCDMVNGKPGSWGQTSFGDQQSQSAGDMDQAADANANADCPSSGKNVAAPSLKPVTTKCNSVDDMAKGTNNRKYVEDKMKELGCECVYNQEDGAAVDLGDVNGPVCVVQACGNRIHASGDNVKVHFIQSNKNTVTVRGSGSRGQIIISRG